MVGRFPSTVLDAFAHRCNKWRLKNVLTFSAHRRWLTSGMGVSVMQLTLEHLWYAIPLLISSSEFYICYMRLSEWRSRERVCMRARVWLANKYRNMNVYFMLLCNTAIRCDAFIRTKLCVPRPSSISGCGKQRVVYRVCVRSTEKRNMKAYMYMATNKTHTHTHVRMQVYGREGVLSQKVKLYL